MKVEVDRTAGTITLKPSEDDLNYMQMIIDGKFMINGLVVSPQPADEYWFVAGNHPLEGITPPGICYVRLVEQN